LNLALAIISFEFEEQRQKMEAREQVAQASKQWLDGRQQFQIQAAADTKEAEGGKWSDDGDDESTSDEASKAQKHIDGIADVDSESNTGNNNTNPKNNNTASTLTNTGTNNANQSNDDFDFSALQKQMQGQIINNDKDS